MITSAMMDEIAGKKNEAWIYEGEKISHNQHMKGSANVRGNFQKRVRHVFTKMKQEFTWKVEVSRNSVSSDSQKEESSKNCVDSCMSASGRGALFSLCG